MRKICIVTGTRAEYGQLHLLMQSIKKSKILKLQLVVTGTHLSSEYGFTINEIVSDGFEIHDKIDMLLSSDSDIGISKSIGLGLISFSDCLKKLNPDLILVLGDRFELLSIVIAALIAKIPIAHVHGGELTEGLIDDAIRHSITKMSHLHFVSTNEYKKRVIQLGEKPKTVFNVGGLSVDNLKKIKLLNKEELQRNLKFKFLEKNILITFHPVTLNFEKENLNQLNELLKGVQKLKDTLLIFTMPNADTYSRKFYECIKSFCKKNSNVYFFKSLGHHNYLSCLRFIDCVVGNSSSGLVEVPSFRKPTINIGDRQKGRLQAKSVINCKPNEKDILSSIKRSYSKAFQLKLKKVKNPYGEGGSVKKILKVLETFDLKDLIKKKFYDLK